MLAPWTDKILGKRLTLVHISADFTYIAFFLCLRLGLDILEIVVVSYRRLVG